METKQQVDDWFFWSHKFINLQKEETFTLTPSSLRVSRFYLAFRLHVVLSKLITNLPLTLFFFIFRLELMQLPWNT